MEKAQYYQDGTAAIMHRDSSQNNQNSIVIGRRLYKPMSASLDFTVDGSFESGGPNKKYVIFFEPDKVFWMFANGGREAHRASSYSVNDQTKTLQRDLKNTFTLASDINVPSLLTLTNAADLSSDALAVLINEIEKVCNLLQYLSFFDLQRCSHHFMIFVFQSMVQSNMEEEE